MDEQDGGSFPCAARRGREIAVHREAVARREGDGFHRGEFVPFEFRQRFEKERRGVFLSVVEVPARWPVRSGDTNGPERIGKIAAFDSNLAGIFGAKVSEATRELRVDRIPF